MIPFKIALASAAAVGTVAVGGGVTYAMVGAPEALPAPVAKPALPAAPAAPAVPALPDCAPTGVDAPSVPSKLPANVPAVPSKVPDVQKGVEEARKGVEQQAQKGVEQAQKGVPEGASKCLPSAPVKAPAPAAPALPEVPAISCSSVPAFVKLHSPAEQIITATSGLDFVSSRTRTLEAQGKTLCSRIQTWKAPGGQWLTVERLQGAANLEQARQALRLPQAQSNPLPLGGTTFLEAPLVGGQGTGIVWTPDPGVAVYVSGSPVYQTQLRQIATQLSQVG